MTISQLKYVITLSDSHSMNEAAKKLYISQPSLSSTIKELEDETGVELFIRSNRGISLTPQGEEFVGYARQVVQQYELMEQKYITREKQKKHFSVSAQHYAFASSAFAEMVKQFGMDEYEFSMYETRTNDVIQDVKNFKSEIGILYLSDFNRKILNKIIDESGLEFHPIADCNAYVYMYKDHPLASNKKLTMEELENYPCLSFEQGINNSFYFAEEMMSTYKYKQLIKICDRATGLNLMRGLNGYTICSGILCEELNGDDYCAVPLDSDEVMTVGYIVRKNMSISEIGKKYLEHISMFMGGYGF